METLPLDIWVEITSWACTDGGATGCALSLVSHNVYRASAVGRYHSVALHGWDSIRQFTRVMNDAKSSKTNLQVVHLFLATVPASASYYTKRCWFANEEDDSNYQLICDKIRNWGTPPDSSNATDLIRDILFGVSNTIKTLSVLGLPAVLLSRPFPVLHTLILHYLEDGVTDSSVKQSADDPMDPLPSLFHVQLVGATACKLSRHFVARCPRITCLLLDRPMYTHEGARPIGLLRRSDIQNNFPPSLSKVLVRIYRYPSKCGHDRRAMYKRQDLAFRNAVRETKLEGIVQIDITQQADWLLSWKQFSTWRDLVEGKDGSFGTEGRVILNRCISVRREQLPGQEDILQVYASSSSFGEEEEVLVAIDWEIDNNVGCKWNEFWR